MKNKFKRIFKWINKRREAFIWLLAILVLAFTEPAGGHLSLCPLYNMGFDFCPGCGLGRSVSLILHGELGASFQMHSLGLFALIILLIRVINIIFFQYKSENTISYE